MTVAALAVKLIVFAEAPGDNVPVVMTVLTKFVVELRPVTKFALDPPPFTIPNVTVPVLLLVKVKVLLIVAVPPWATKDISLLPARCTLAIKAVAPQPLSNVVPFIVMSLAKLVAGHCPVKFQTPPEFMVTLFVKVRVPVAPVAVLTVPVIEDVPVVVKAKLPMVKTAEPATLKFPATVKMAPVVVVPVDTVKLLQGIRVCGTAVADC